MSKKKKAANVMKVIDSKEKWDAFYNDTENVKLCSNLSFLLLL